MSIKHRHITLIFLIAIGILFLPIASEAQSFKTESGHVEFESSVPLHSFTGTSNKLVGRISLADSTVDFYLDLHTLDTGIDKRDNDMLETLNAKKYPFAEFYGKLISDFNPDTTSQQQVTVKGKFTLHNVSKKVSIDGTFQKSAEGLTVKASWIINMKDYNIRPPGILFYRVSEEINISINALLPKEN
ncbi:Polyisoprenoid-binding protein YceI [Fodinibius salinus]|uniref:Polyisoprenoid-binding protein YceI n=1 Tax=Fodinibius salinus TaxID=860790 RepID=A0A5D3YN09_9BACT|nr:YceI family protein [Fodinibius salinus]TYP95177.1 Polyisoprenoid-binding protein YceI [Fodinibius salinus]